MIYKTSLDNTAKITTVLITILFVGLIFLQITLINDIGNLAPIITIISLFSIYVGAFLFRPINYALNNDEIIVHRIISNVKLKFTEIKTVSILDNRKLSWSWRIIGVGGLFGYWGKFTNNKIGTMRWYVTNKKNAILIVLLSNKNIVISPNEPLKFVEEFNNLKVNTFKI